MIALTVKQMQTLQEKGLNLSKYKCQLGWCLWDDDSWRLLIDSEDCILPAFTLGDILNILPAYSLIRTANGTIRIGAKCGDDFIEYKGNSELEIAYQMLLQCLDNNYIK